MNILRHLYLSTACRSPDEPAAVEGEEVIEPAAEVVAEAIEEPVIEAQPEPELILETPAPEPIKAEPHDDKVFRRVIAEVREEKRQERTLREAAEQRAADLQAILERMQNGEKPESVTRAGPIKAPETDFQAAVKAQVAMDRLYEDSSAVKSAGMSAFPDFGESLAKLNDVNVMSNDFVADLLAVDKDGAHIIIDKLARNLEKATSLASMDSRRRIVELTRMAEAPKAEPKPAEAPKPAAISKAPAPKPAISPLAAAPEIDPTTAEGNEKMSDRQFEQWYKSKYQKRA